MNNIEKKTFLGEVTKLTSSELFNLSIEEMRNKGESAYLDPLTENHILDAFNSAEIDEWQMQNFLNIVYQYPHIQIQTVENLPESEMKAGVYKRKFTFSEIVHNHLNRIHEFIDCEDNESTMRNETPCRKAVLKLRSCLSRIENLNKLENFMLTVDLNKFSKDDIVSIFNLVTAIKLCQDCRLELPTFITEISDSDLNETTSRPEPVFFR